MIIDFTFDNFTSFRDEVSFSMMKTGERQHSDHIANASYGLKLLPVAAIFGANASGKSNFVGALSAMKNLIVSNITNIHPFMLDNNYQEKETIFTIKLLMLKHVYEYSFSILKGVIQKEHLKKINSKGEIFLYECQNKKIKLNAINGDKINNRLEVQFEGTDTTQLFLNNVYFQNRNNDLKELQDFKNVYHWFKELVIITPESFSNTKPFGDNNYDKTNALISLFDLGFDKGDVHREEITDPEVIKRLKETFNHNNLSNALQAEELKRIGCFIEEKDGKYYTSQILLSYKMDEKEARLPFLWASDGSKRIIHLAPALNMLLEQDVVIVIDELDRSLHTLLARRFIEKFLEDCSSDRRSQFIFTTHDVTLMNQDIFRRDELWIVERTNEHVSKMFSLIEYKDIRNDKDIRRSYLNGRFGGIPKILL